MGQMCDITCKDFLGSKNKMKGIIWWLKVNFDLKGMDSALMHSLYYKSQQIMADIYIMSGKNKIFQTYQINISIYGEWPMAKNVSNTTY